jgi:hypothetical protein
MKASDPSVSPWAAGVKAARDNAIPSFVILLAATALVVGYYQVPTLRAWLDIVGTVNREHPLAFAMLCTGFTAGVIPWCFRMAFPGLRPARPGLDLLHSVVWWMFMGVVVCYFYVAQGHWFGTEPSFGVVVCKVAVDQLGFTVLCGAPFNATASRAACAPEARCCCAATTPARQRWRHRSQRSHTTPAHWMLTWQTMTWQRTRSDVP